jgi:hypothetical protein
MEAPSVVEGLEVVEKGSGGGTFGIEGKVIAEDFRLQRSKGAFRESVIIAITLGAHALAQSMSGEQPTGDAGRVLAAAIGVKDRSPRHQARVDGPGDRIDDQIGVKGVGEFPAENSAGEQIDDDSQIEPALPGSNVGDVAHELSTRSRRRPGLREQIGRRMRRIVWPGGLGPERAPGASSQAV